MAVATGIAPATLGFVRCVYIASKSKNLGVFFISISWIEANPNNLTLAPLRAALYYQVLEL